MNVIFDEITRQTHVLIGGTTGAGKSVVIRGIISALVSRHPARVKLALIDPKKVELYPYRRAPHCIAYADTPQTIADTIRDMCGEMDGRYSAMQAAEIRDTTAPHIYIVIDELADLLDTCGGDCKRDLKRLLQLGRAAGIHIIAATQHPERRVLPAEIQLNFTAVLALRCKSAIESRQLIGMQGAEALEIGTAYYTAPGVHPPRRVSIPLVSDADIMQTIAAYKTTPAAPTIAPTAAAPPDTYHGHPEPQTPRLFDRLVNAIFGWLY